MLSRDELAAEALVEKLRVSRVGVIAKGIDGIDPGNIANLIAEKLGDKIYVSIVGYNITSVSEKVILSRDIESAVDWRSTPDFAGRILVFIQDDVPKLHSLGDMDQANSRDVACYLLKWAENNRDISINQPQIKFWQALEKESATFPLNLIEDFIREVLNDRGNLNAIPKNCWRLGLLRDEDLLHSGREPLERLFKNRELIIEIGLLSEQSRKRLSGVLARSTGIDRERLQKTYLNLKSFYRTGAKDALKNLEVGAVEELLRASKPVLKSSNTIAGNQVIIGGNEDDHSSSGNRPLKGRQLTNAIAGQTVEGTDDSRQGLHELGESLLNRIRNSQESSSNVTILKGFADHTIQLDTPNQEYIQFVGFSCSATNWGGILRTNQEGLKEAILRYTPQDFEPYDPSDISKGIAGQCLFSLLRHFDEYVLHNNFFENAIERLVASRAKLLEFIELLFIQPFVLFGGYPEAREALNEYIDAYSSILSAFRLYEGEMHGHDSDALRFVATEFLRLDVIHIQTPNSWKAILTPLHPFHLWRYREILKTIHAVNRQLSEDEKRQLSEALPDLPHAIHFLVFSPDVTGGVSVKLPLSGSLETLPMFENHTNRYLGNDGLEYIIDLLQKYEKDAPYSRSQIRIGLVDVPDITLALKLVAEHLVKRKDSQIVIEAYFTRGQNPSGELTRLDYDDKDHELGELLRSGRIRVQFISRSSIIEVCDSLIKRPTHITYLFDQSLYGIKHAPRARQLLVSPLVISYEYDYSETFHRGSIAPSSEAEDGIFADFHFLVERAASLPAGQQLRLQYESHEGLSPINLLLTNGAAKWLSIADRSLTGYAPESAVLLNEKTSGQREIAVWARASTRSVGQFIDLLRRYNLRPDNAIVSDLMYRFGHIAAGGLMSLLSSGGNSQYREAQQKGFLGTVIAAEWYSKQYPDSLIASLDSELARRWLSGRQMSDKRADLIGLRVDQEGQLIIEPIEVKSRADDAGGARIDLNSQGQRIAIGLAVEQLKAMLEALNPIFGDVDNDQQQLFTPARREVLRYQLHRECFRDIHEHEWQRAWYQRLKLAFSVPEPKLTINLRGLILHLKFEENSNVEWFDDEEKPITVVTLGTQAIQKLVVSQSEILTEQIQDPDSEISGNDMAENAIELVNIIEENSFVLQHNLVDSDTPESLISNVAEAFEMYDAVAVTSSNNDTNEEDEAEELTRLFRRACQSYRIALEECDHLKAVVGPTVWRFFIRLARGQRLDPLRNSLEDIGREMRKSGLLISSLPDSDFIALDIPRRNRQTVSLTEGLNKLPSITSPEQMPIVIGVTPEKECLIHDLGKMPHLLIGGTTGSGKTVFLYGILTSLLKTHPLPSSLRLMISTSKPEDFMFFEGLPHLETGEIIADAEVAIRLLETNVKETFEQRLEILRKSRCRDIVEYNNKHPESPLCPLVVVVDEFADLADQLSSDKPARESFYTNVRRIAQLGRSRGIHLILCTQRPSRDLVPTNIRNLMNSRVSLRVNDATASRMILEESGGEQLQKYGDLLYKDENGVIRAQGYFISTSELEEFLLPLMI